MGLTEEETKLSEKYQFFVGKELNKAIFRVKGKHMIEFAESVGLTSPKYTKVETGADGKPDYSGIVAVPTYPNCWTVDCCFDMVNWTYPESANKFITNYGKVLHTSQFYDYSKAEVPIQHGQKLYTTGILAKAYIKADKLWLENHLDTKTTDGKLVVQSRVMVCVRQGGY
ncbi:MAG: hypothetical protein EU530_06330 [Promethearchaeota archaeon]|nr:MAG: hypothetical protein EU530_06330 [Candidatus Lokiarchaeota archaeon]